MLKVPSSVKFTNENPLDVTGKTVTKLELLQFEKLNAMYEAGDALIPVMFICTA